MTSITRTARNASLADLAALLQDQHARKIDVVASASAFTSRNGVIHVNGTEQQLSLDGVTTTAGAYNPTEVFDGHIAEKLDIPVKYVRRMRVERPDLYDATVNGWIHGGSYNREGYQQLAEKDARSFLFRGFKNDDGEVGVARALLSQRYGITDNLDVLMAVLSGVRASGVEIDVQSADLTDRRMYVKIAAPAVATLAPELLKGYRSPYSGNSGDENPTVFAGFIVSNSEVGGGAFTITPRLIVQVCTNGLTLTKDAMRSVHLGGKMEEGVVVWSEDTQQKNLDVITAKARDAVATFLDVEYVKKAVAKLEQAAGVPVSNAAETIEVIGKKLAFSQAEINLTLDHFIKGGQLTAGGIMQAVTSAAQSIEDADAAMEFEAKGVEAMELAAAR